MFRENKKFKIKKYAACKDSQTTNPNKRKIISDREYER